MKARSKGFNNDVTLLQPLASKQLFQRLQMKCCQPMHAADDEHCVTTVGQCLMSDKVFKNSVVSMSCIRTVSSKHCLLSSELQHGVIKALLTVEWVAERCHQTRVAGAFWARTAGSTRSWRSCGRRSARRTASCRASCRRRSDCRSRAPWRHAWCRDWSSHRWTKSMQKKLLYIWIVLFGT